MKIWKLTLRRSSGANNSLRRSLSLHSLPSDNFWENETMQLKHWYRQRGSTKNNIDTLTFDVCPFPTSSSVSPWSPTTSYFKTSPEFPDSPRPYPQKIFLQGYMEVDRNGKMSSGRTYNRHSICLRWIDLLKQDHTFLRHSMDSNAWLSIAGDYQSLNTYSF